MKLLDPLLDASIVFSFDRTGFRRHEAGFRPGALDVDLAGKVCLVTGASSGIGRATAAALARRGAKVRLLCRSRERGEDAQRAVVEETGSRSVHVDIVDVASLRSIREFAKRLSERRIDVLVNNAGVLVDTWQRTEDGLERTLATNLVGPFLLTELLLPRLRESGGARVVNVSSGGMYAERLRVKELDPGPDGFDGVKAYARTKRALVVLTELWAERLRDAPVLFASMHPGWADTPGVRSSLPWFHAVTRAILRSPEEGADTVVWLAVSPDAAGQSGLFWFDREPRPTHLLPFTQEDAEERARLRDACMSWAGL